MAAGEIRAGAAYVEARVKDGTKAGIDAIEARVKRMGEAVADIGTKMAVAGAGITAALAPAILAAGDLQDTMGKFDAVFKETAAANRQWAEDFRKEVGRSKQEIYGFMADAQGLLVGIDFDRSKAAEISQTITKLSLDLQAFAGGSGEDAFKALISGISGESEPLKKYGVLLSETAVAAELLKKNMKIEDASNTEKVMARLAIIMRSTADAQGALARESQGFNAQFSRLKASLSDAAVAIGQSVLPTVTALAGRVGDLGQGMAEWAAANPTLVTGIAALGGGLLVVGGALVGIGKGIAIFTALKASILIATTAMQGMTLASLAFLATPLGATLAVVGVVAASVGYMAYKASQDMDELRKATERAGEARKALDAGDSRRKDDQTAVERLKQLNELQELDADQKKEAATLVQQLNGHYDGLNLSVDGATGKVVGLAGAFETLAKAMRENAIDDVATDIRKLQEQLEAQRDARGGGFLRGAADTLTLGQGGFSGDKINAQDKEIAETMKKLDEAKKRLAGIRGGDTTAVSGNPTGPASTAQKVEEGAKAAVARKEAEQDAAKKLAELRDSLIEDQYNREVAQINRKYDEESARLKKMGGDTKAIEQARQIELDKAKLSAEQRWKKEKDERDMAAKESKDQRDKEAKDAEGKIADRANLERAMQKELLEAQSKAAEASGDKGAVERIRKQLRELGKLQANADFEKKLDDSGYSEQEKARLRKIQEQIQKTQDDTPVKSRVFQSAGTFDGSATAIRGLGFDDAKKTAKNTEEMAKSLKRIEKKDSKGARFT